MERKLTTVLAADVVGYSALMERDEAGTHERLKAGRQGILRAGDCPSSWTCIQTDGRWDAGRVRTSLTQSNARLACSAGLPNATPKCRRISASTFALALIREVIVEGDDRYGEGVNIALVLTTGRAWRHLCFRQGRKGSRKEIGFRFRADGRAASEKSPSRYRLSDNKNSIERQCHDPWDSPNRNSERA